MADESAIIATYLYATLSASGALAGMISSRIYDTDVPEPLGTVSFFPCVVFQEQAASDVVGMGGVRIMVNPVWVVKVIVDDDTYQNAGTIYALVDQLLHGSKGSTSAGEIFSCVRENDQIRFSEQKEGGGYYRHRGGAYRIEARANVTP
jgi:hypothetical protein